MKYTELVKLVDSEFYTLEAQVTIDVTFHEDYFIWEFDKIEDMFVDGEELSQDELNKKLTPAFIESIKNFVDKYDFKSSAIRYQGRKGEQG